MSKPIGDPGTSVPRNPPGPLSRKMSMSLLVGGISAMAGIYLLSRYFPQDVRGIGSLAPGALVAAFVVGAAAFHCLETRSAEKRKGPRDTEPEAEAEESVGKIFEGLPAGNFVIHNFDSGKGATGRVLIGPKGIFTLETKNHTGVVTFDGNTFLRNGRPLEQDPIRRAWSRCFLVRGLLAEWGIVTPPAEPVILFTKASVTMKEKAKGVEIAEIRSLAEVLERLPNRLSIPEAERIYSRILAASVL